MQLIGALLIIIGIIDFGLSWIGIDLTSQFVGTSLSRYTPVIFGVIGGILYSIGGKGGEKEQIISESHNITVEDNTSITSNQNNDDSIESKESDTKEISEKNPESFGDRLQKLADLKEKGLINEDDFNSKKEEILKGM